MRCATILLHAAFTLDFKNEKVNSWKVKRTGTIPMIEKFCNIEAMCNKIPKWSTRVTPLPSFSFFLVKTGKRHAPRWEVHVRF
jgi:hypothetical protein